MWLTLSALAAALVLASCGGGAPGVSTGTVQPTWTINVVLNDQATGAARNTLTLGSPLNATATLLDASGKPVANALVQFALDMPGSSAPIALLSPASGTAATDASGSARLALQAASASAQGAGTITAKANMSGTDYTAAIAFQVQPDSNAVKNLALKLTDPATGATRNALTFSSPLNATATLQDASGKPVANTLVQFALDMPGSSTPIAVLSPSSGTAVTDASGTATISLQAASVAAQGAGTISVKAALSGAEYTDAVAFQVQPDGSVAKSLSLTLTDVATGAARSALTVSAPLNATATVRDGSGKPVAGALVQLAFAPLNADAKIIAFSPASGTGITDAAGQFVWTVYAAGPLAEGAGTLTVTTTVDGAPKTAQANVQVSGASGIPNNIAIVLTAPSTGQPSNALTFGLPLDATAKLLDAAGQPIANALMQFSLTAPGSSAPIAVFSPASGTASTDSTGVARVSLQAASIYSQGAGVITATAKVDSSPTGILTASTAYTVSPVNVTLSSLALSPATINAFQTSQVSVAVGGVPANFPVTVNFSSPCVTAGLATLASSAITVNGVATATYTDKGCGGSDTITVSATGASSVQRILTIVPAPATGLNFISAAPSTISISGVGGVSNALVTFKVVNALQLPVSGVSVTMSLSTSVGSVLLDGQAGAVAKQSGADGTVSVTVSAGSQPGPVRVRATALGGSLSALSSELTIQTGVPTQSRFSLSVETFNIEGWNVDGTTTGVTIRAADRVGNPVPDGTVINFRSSGAAIQPSCQTSGGACSVKFVSQASRPASGRVAVLAYAIGEESFTDLNGNNRYDAGEAFGDLGDAFVDANLNGVFDPGEDYIAFNPAANQPCAPSPLGALSRPNSCDGVWGLANVRASAQIVLSGSAAFTSQLPSVLYLYGVNMIDPATPVVVCTSGSFSFNLFDVNHNPMPAGTTVSATSSSGDITAVVYGSPVISTVSQSGTTIAVDLSAKSCTGTNTASVRLTVKSPLGMVTTLPAIAIAY